MKAYYEEFASNIVAPCKLHVDKDPSAEIIGVIKGQRVHVIFKDESHLSFGLNTIVKVEAVGRPAHSEAKDVKEGWLVMSYECTNGERVYRKVGEVVSDQTRTMIGFTNGTWASVPCLERVTVLR